MIKSHLVKNPMGGWICFKGVWFGTGATPKAAFDRCALMANLASRGLLRIEDV